MSLSAYPPPMRTSNSLPLQADGIHGISPRKVYTATSVTTRAVGSYPTFSPLPALESRVGEKQMQAVYFLLHYLSWDSRLPVRKYGALWCSDFPLVCIHTSDKTHGHHLYCKCTTKTPFKNSVYHK